MIGKSLQHLFLLSGHGDFVGRLHGKTGGVEVWLATDDAVCTWGRIPWALVTGMTPCGLVAALPRVSRVAASTKLTCKLQWVIFKAQVSGDGGVHPGWPQLSRYLRESSELRSDSAGATPAAKIAQCLHLLTLTSFKCPWRLFSKELKYSPFLSCNRKLSHHD